MTGPAGTALPPEFAYPRIATRKITGYLLNRRHPEGASKAEFFEAFGFSMAAKDCFISALFKHARQENFVRSEQTLWGIKYIFEGRIEAPDGRNPRIRSIWQTVGNDPFPNLVSAYPI